MLGRDALTTNQHVARYRTSSRRLGSCRHRSVRESRPFILCARRRHVEYQLAVLQLSHRGESAFIGHVRACVSQIDAQMKNCSSTKSLEPTAVTPLVMTITDNIASPASVTPL